MLRILIADDHPIVREGLKQILADAQDMVVAGEAENGPEALEKARREGFDIILLDITMSGMSGIEVLKHLKGERPDLPVLVLSIHPEEEYAVRALKAGASGYLTKDSAPDKLVSAIRQVASGRKYVSDTMIGELVSALGKNEEASPREGLSDREYDIMLLIAAGKRVKEIASVLSLSPKTVSTYRARVLEKMRLASNAEITRYALERRLLG